MSDNIDGFAFVQLKTIMCFNFKIIINFILKIGKINIIFLNYRGCLNFKSIGSDWWKVKLLWFIKNYEIAATFWGDTHTGAPYDIFQGWGDWVRARADIFYPPPRKKCPTPWNFIKIMWSFLCQKHDKLGVEGGKWATQFWIFIYFKNIFL